MSNAGADLSLVAKGRMPPKRMVDRHYISVILSLLAINTAP